MLDVITIPLPGAHVLITARAFASGNWQTLKVISARDGVIASSTVPPGTEASVTHIYKADAGDFTSEITQHPERLPTPSDPMV